VVIAKKQTGKTKLNLFVKNFKSKKSGTTSKYRMRTFQQFLLENQRPPSTLVPAFMSLPWNWQKLQKAKVINGMYYYSPGNYDVNGQPEQIPDGSFSLITLQNIKDIAGDFPPNQLSYVNRSSGKPVNQNEFQAMVRNPKSWYDEKINQVYNSIKMLGKRPEDFGGKDIRPQAQAQMQQQPVQGQATPIQQQ